MRPQLPKSPTTPFVYNHNDNANVNKSILSVLPEGEPWKPHKLQGQVLHAEENQQPQMGPESMLKNAQDLLSNPFNMLPLKEAIAKPDYVPPKTEKCTNHKPLLQHELSDKGLAHIMQGSSYSPYAKQSTTDPTKKTIGFGSLESFGTDWFSRFPQGVTKQQSLGLAREDTFHDVQNTKRIFGANNPTVSQEQFDALVGLTRNVGAANLTKYTDLQSLVGNQKYAEAGVVINQIVSNTPSLKSQSNSLALLWNQCDYGTATSKGSGLFDGLGLGNSNGSSDGLMGLGGLGLGGLGALFGGLGGGLGFPAYVDNFFGDDYGNASPQQQLQIAGVAAQENRLLRLSEMYPNNVHIATIAKLSQDNFAGFKKHEFYIQPVADPSQYQTIFSDPIVEETYNIITPTITKKANLLGCEDLIQYAENFQKTMQLTSNYRLSDFTMSGSINGQLAATKTEVVCNLRALAMNILEPMITAGILKQNIVIVSALRNGNETNPHYKGQAIDFYIKNYNISAIDAAIWIEENLPTTFDEIVIMNCGNNVSTVHVTYNQYNETHLRSRQWKPTLDRNIYLDITQVNGTYGGGWKSFREMKNNTSKSKINVGWLGELI